MNTPAIELDQPSPVLHVAPDPAATALEIAGVRHDHALVSPAPVGPPRPHRSRNGKIARLPKPERDMVNRMLFNHLPYATIVAALDEIGIHVTERNVSNWKTRGGYCEWCRAQEHALNLHRHQDHLVDFLRRADASELSEVGLQAAATQLSNFFLTPEANQLLSSDANQYDRRLAMLARVSTQLQGLQKYRDDSAKQLGGEHYPERVRRETEKQIEVTRATYSSTIPKSSKEPQIPHRNYLAKP